MNTAVQRCHRGGVLIAIVAVPVCALIAFCLYNYMLDWRAGLVRSPAELVGTWKLVRDGYGFESLGMPVPNQIEIAESGADEYPGVFVADGQSFSFKIYGPSVMWRSNEASPFAPLGNADEVSMMLSRHPLVSGWDFLSIDLHLASAGNPGQDEKRLRYERE